MFENRPNGGDEGNRTPVQNCIKKIFYERSRLFRFLCISFNRQNMIQIDSYDKMLTQIFESKFDGLSKANKVGRLYVFDV